MGLYKNFIDILRHTKDNKAFTTDEVVTALEQTVINENKINDEVLQRATDVSKLAQNITMVENNLSGRISNLNNALSSSINQVNNELSSRLNIVESDSYVTTNKIRNNAVVSTKIADGAVTTEKIASKSINASKIADHSIGSTQLDNLSINKNNLNLELQKEIGEISSLENNIFQFKNFDMTIECIFPSVIPPLEFRDGQEDEGEYISLMPSVPTIKINGVERYISNDINYCSIPTSGTSYIYYRYDAEYDILSANYRLESQEPKFEADGSWIFTAYMYDNIRLEFKVSSGGDYNDGDYYVLETYSGDFDVTNVDISGTTPVAKLNHTFPTYLGELSDLKTTNKDCLVAAINENVDSIKKLNKSVFESSQTPINLKSTGVENITETEYCDSSTGITTKSIKVNILCEITPEQDINKIYIDWNHTGLLSKDFCSSHGVNYVELRINDVLIDKFWNDHKDQLMRFGYAIHWNGDKWETIEYKTLKSRIDALESTVGTANDTLAALLSEGV